jgi:hypothetical protein
LRFFLRYFFFLLVIIAINAIKIYNMNLLFLDVKIVIEGSLYKIMGI